ncbi:MAG: endolytic transglycosylase MltG [Sphingopyxis sp.]|nr:endolytic transglycosylase MltG [Sphingopyxis sp.]
MARAFLALLLAFLLAACAGGAQRDTNFVIPEGASMTRAAQIMEEAGAVEDAGAFLRHARLFGSDEPIKPGEYEVKAGASAGDVLAMLQAGRTRQRFVTIPEGWPSILVWERLMANPHLTGEIPVPAEGSVLPDTYAISKGEPRAAVVARMQAAMDRAFAEAWAERSSRAVPQDRNQTITLASIIEKETSKAEERSTVAGVYTNRLRIGMRLQADPTIIYPITQGKPLGRRIRRSEIAAVNGYNTYSMAGLPVGPIANPGRESIRAALNPGETEYIYFVADGTGGHIFARTLAEHNANVERWFAIRRARGEME